MKRPAVWQASHKKRKFRRRGGPQDAVRHLVWLFWVGGCSGIDPDGSSAKADGSFVSVDGSFARADELLVRVDGRLVEADGLLVRIDGSHVSAGG